MAWCPIRHHLVVMRTFRNTTMKILIDLPRGVCYPTMAAIPFKQCVVQTENYLKLNWHLCENGEPIPSYKKVVAKWPDGSIKWAHVYAIFKGDKEYNFNQLLSQVVFPSTPIIPPDEQLNWTLEVKEKNGALWTNTAADRASLTEVRTDEFSLNSISPKGSRIYNSSDETKCIEINDPVVRQIRYEGWLNPEHQNRFLRYCTRVTKYSDSPISKISLSITFAGRMRDKEITSIGFSIPTQNNTGKAFYGINGDINSKTSPPLLRTLQVHQRRIDVCEVTGFDEFQRIPGKSDGFVSNGSVSVFVRNFWQKFPQSLGCKQSNIIYNQCTVKTKSFPRKQDWKKKTSPKCTICITVPHC